MRQNLLDSIVIGPIRCRPVVCAALLASWAAGCTPRAAEGAPQAPAAPAAPAQQPEGPSLARKYDSLFPIGAAVDPTSLQTHAPLLQQHFNSVTPENEMKFESLERTEGAFD
jgi:GH35 family endo-1,4-beta-xylanase